MNTSPELIHFTDGTSGYFYTVQQLEYIRDRYIDRMSPEDIRANFRDNSHLQGFDVPRKVGTFSIHKQRHIT